MVRLKREIRQTLDEAKKHLGMWRETDLERCFQYFERFFLSVALIWYQVCTSCTLPLTAALCFACETLPFAHPVSSVETLSSAAITSAAITGGITYVASPAHCPHTEVVRQQEASPAPMPEADAVFSGAEFERALDRVPAGIFNDDTLQAMRQRTDHAQKEEVPLLVGMGDTNWFAVREGAKINDDEIGEWAHVKWERDSGSNLFQCKVRVSLSFALRWRNLDTVHVPFRRG